jgi:hypothetical protein
LLQTIGNLPGLPGRFPKVRLEGIDNSQNFQGFAGLEGFRIWE